MTSELSAGCECRLFGTGLVMSENASDCTQNAAYRHRQLKNFLGRGHSQTLPHWGWGHPSQNPTSSAPWSLAPRRLDSTCCPSTFTPPHLTLLAMGLGWAEWVIFLQGGLSGHLSTGWVVCLSSKSASFTLQQQQTSNCHSVKLQGVQKML